MVGSVPGCPRQTGQVCTFGSSPKESSQPQNIFVLVESWTWIPSPITGSYSATGRPLEADRPLEGVGSVEHARVAEGRPRDLEADREVMLPQARGYRDRGDPGQRHRHRAVVREIHRQRVVGSLPQP